MGNDSQDVDFSEQTRLFETLFALLFALTGLLLFALPLIPYEAAIPSLQWFLQIVGLFAGGITAVIVCCEKWLVPRGQWTVMRPGMALLLSGYAFLLCVSVFGAEAQRDALLDACKRILPLIPFFVAIAFYPRSTARANFVGGLYMSLLLAAFVSSLVYGIYQYVFVFPELIDTVEEGGSAIEQVVGDNTSSLLRRVRSRSIFSTFTLPNAFASYVAALLPLFIGLAVDLGHKSRNARQRRAKHILTTGSLISSLLAVLALVNLFLTGSKGAGVALVAGLGVMCLLYRQDWWRRYWPFLSAAGVLAVILGTLVSFTDVLPVGPITTMEFRRGYWHGTVNVITESPKHFLAGTGPGNFKDWYHYLRPDYARDVGAPHNSYLAIWAVGGIFALLCFLGAIGTYFYKALKWGPPRFPQDSSEVSQIHPMFVKKLYIAYFAVIAAVVVILTARTGLSVQQWNMFLFWLFVPVLTAGGALFWLVWLQNNGMAGNFLFCRYGCMSGVVVFLVHSLVAVNWQVPGVAVTFLFLVLLYWFGSDAVQPAPVQRTSPLARRVTGGILALLIIAIGFLWIRPAYTSRIVAANAKTRTRTDQAAEEEPPREQSALPAGKREEISARQLNRVRRDILQRLQQDQHAPELWLVLGQVNTALWQSSGDVDRWEEALTSWRRVARLRPISSPAHYRVAQLYQTRLNASEEKLSQEEKNKLLKKAERYLREAIELNPCNITLYKEMAHLMERQGKEASAQEYTAKAKQIQEKRMR